MTFPAPACLNCKELEAEINRLSQDMRKICIANNNLGVNFVDALMLLSEVESHPLFDKLDEGLKKRIRSFTEPIEGEVT